MLGPLLVVIGWLVVDLLFDTAAVAAQAALTAAAAFLLGWSELGMAGGIFPRQFLHQEPAAEYGHDQGDGDNEINHAEPPGRQNP